MQAPAHSATSRQSLSPGLTLPEPRHLSKTLALALAGGVSSTPHPNPLLMWHSWQMVAGQIPLRDTCVRIVHSHVLLRKQPQSNAYTNPYSCTHNANLVATPGYVPLATKPHSLLKKVSPTLFVCPFFLLNFPPLSGTGWTWGSPASPSQIFTFSSFHLPFTTCNFLGFYSRIPLKVLCLQRVTG